MISLSAWTENRIRPLSPTRRAGLIRFRVDRLFCRVCDAVFFKSNPQPSRYITWIETRDRDNIKYHTRWFNFVELFSSKFVSKTDITFEKYCSYIYTRISWIDLDAEYKPRIIYLMRSARVRKLELPIYSPPPSPWTQSFNNAVGTHADAHPPHSRNSGVRVQFFFFLPETNRGIPRHRRQGLNEDAFPWNSNYRPTARKIIRDVLLRAGNSNCFVNRINKTLRGTARAFTETWGNGSR